METWGATRYGDPCRECSYDWSISTADALVLVAGIPARYAELLTGTDGRQRHPDLTWTTGAYVCHVVDNLRIWAERLAGALLGGSRQIPGYNENLLAQARAYQDVPLAGALWSLQHATRQWQEAVELAHGTTWCCCMRGGASSGPTTWCATTLTTPTTTSGTYADL